MPPAVAHAPIVHQEPRLAPHLLDALDVVRGGDGTLHEREVVGAVDRGARGFEEVGDVERVGHREQLVLAVEQGELAPVAARELPHGQ